MDLHVPLQAALLAGAISFLSPCVLPLVPSYLCFITGATLDELSDGDGASVSQQRRAFLAAVFFVLGFSTVFITLGASASALGQTLRQAIGFTISIAGYEVNVATALSGLVIMLMGLHFIGLFNIGLLHREARYHQQSQPVGFWGAYGIGLAFAFGWTPCIGPILATILTIAASEQDVARGAGLLAIYSLGLGIPFLLAAAGVGTFLGFSGYFRKHLVTVERVMGVLLVLTGLMFITGSMQSLSYWLLEQFPWLATIG
jgi:cytochrome c-type biogenesis protein